MAAHFRAVDNAVEKIEKVKEYIDNGLGVTLDVALDLEEVCQDSNQVTELQDTMMQYASMERELNRWLEAVELGKTEFKTKCRGSSDDIPNIEDIFDEKLASLEERDSDFDLHSHSKVKEFAEKVWHIHHQGQPMPHADNQSGEDEDIIVSQAPVEQFKCPLTQREMVKPMKSKKCGHNYEHDAILQHIASRSGKAKCPVCVLPITKSDLELNTVLEHSIKRKNRRK